MPGYIENDIVHGVMDVNLSSWKDFHSYVVEEMLNYSHYVWRGQGNSEWGLESSLDRLAGTSGKTLSPGLLAKHLGQFQMASLGRRGKNPPVHSVENDWWALGQHNGLATPLLDWTKSPFVALFFAFEKEMPPLVEHRAVWALSGFMSINKDLPEEGTRLQYVRPKQDENARLVSQAGLFTRAPLGENIRSWVEKYHAMDKDETALLIRILVPNTDREECLRMLTMMNINHASLFPDLYGSGKYCNTSFAVKGYGV